MTEVLRCQSTMLFEQLDEVLRLMVADCRRNVANLEFWLLDKDFPRALHAHFVQIFANIFACLAFEQSGQIRGM